MEARGGRHSRWALLCGAAALTACSSGDSVDSRDGGAGSAPDVHEELDVSLGRLVEEANGFAGMIPAGSGSSGEYYGAISADVNGDGRPDVLGWSDRGWSLFHQGADGGFTQASRSAEPMRCAGFGDLDGDGAPDAVLARREPRFLRNEGGALIDRTALALGGPGAKDEIFGITFADVDSDGLLDVAAAVMNCGVGLSRVYRNEGDFHFVDVAPEMGLTLPGGAAFSLAMDAVDDDGVLHVWNFPEGCTEQRMRHWRFRAGDDLPVRVDERGTDADWANPMGSALLDVDGDGRLDLFMSAGGRNVVLGAPEFVTTLRDQRGLGDHPSRFENLASAWSMVLLDADQDGAPDVYVTHNAARPELPPITITDALYLRTPMGRYQDIGGRVGIDRDQDCQAAFGVDLDRDGDTDLLAGCRAGVRVLRNDLVTPSNGRTLTLRGTVSNPDGVHALLDAAGGRRRAQRGGGQPYASGVVRESFRAADGPLTVRWPSGIHQRVELGADPTLTVTEPRVVQVTPRRVAVGSQAPVRVVVDPGALGTPTAAVRVALTAGARWTEPLAMGADGRWQGVFVPPMERSTTAVTVTVGALTLRVRPKVFVR